MMEDKIFLRPLRIEDAATSYKWRNDPEIWKYTGKKPDKIITYEIERNWISEKLKLKDEKRFAIILKENNQYIGNVQLTNIVNDSAEFHIFIGEKKYWGKGYGKEATIQMINIGFKEMKLKEIYLEVDKENIPAIKVYEKVGFKISSFKDTKIIMKIINNDQP